VDSLALASIAITSAASIVMQIIAALKEERRHIHRLRERIEAAKAHAAMQTCIEELRDNKP